MKGAQGEKVEAVQKPRKFSTGAAHHQDGGMDMHGAQPLGTCLELSFCSLLIAAVELARGSIAIAVRPIVLD